MYTYYKIFDSVSQKYSLGKNFTFNEIGELFYSKEVAIEWLEYFQKTSKSKKVREIDLSLVEFVSDEQLIIFDFYMCVEKVLHYIEERLGDSEFYNASLFVNKTLSNYIIEEHQDLINLCKIYIPFKKLSDEELYLSNTLDACVRKALEYYNLTIQKDV